ncbi:MAG: hypothetical protein AABZ30_02305 [Myxococcota bacterium]
MVLRVARHAAWLGVYLLPACGPSESRGYERFEAEALPVLEARCASTTCHGVAADAEERGEVIDWSYFFVRVGADGRVADPRQAYDAAKGRINTVERPEFSTLLRKPLPAAAGGLPHWGGADFTGREDDSYVALRDWIATEEGGGEGKLLGELPPLAQEFARDVLPALATRQCMNQNCHGPTSPFTSFAAPLPLDGELVFPAADVEKNYATARHFVNAGGAAASSRLVRKVLPLDPDPAVTGGIAHRGGNRLFFTGADDPDVQAILAWAEAIRAEELGTTDVPIVRGVVLVRGPVASERPFELNVFSPGTDLWIVDRQIEQAGAPARNLTATLHPDGPADARDPAVSHDAERVAFAMRLAASGSHNLYEMRLDGTGLRQLTFDDDPEVANRHPVYGPDGRVTFASSRAGHAADGVDLPDAELWAVDPASGALERLTFDPAPEARPFWIGTGKSYGTLGFTVLRAIGGRYEGAIFRGPVLDRNKAFHPDPEIHVHHGLTMPEDIAWAMRTLPDGRFATILLGRDAPYPAGPLAIVERQFGPEVPDGAEDDASAFGFRHAVARVDDARAWWDPAPANDGSIFAAVADPATPNRPRVVRLWLEEDPTTGLPFIGRELRVTDLANRDSAGEWEPEPIVVRPLEDDLDHAWAWDPTASTGVINYRHVETLEALFASLEVRGTKTVRDDVRYVRLVESLAVPSSAREGTTLTPYGPASVLGEIETPDGSFLCEVPANVPFRIQLLDANRMAVGAQQNRWIHVAPGETFPGGVAPEIYPTACAGCHGSLSGAPEDALGPPDAITRASITLATHENRDPRRPRAPVPLGRAPIAADFVSDVRPIVERCCTTCPAPEPSGPFDALYRHLLDEGLVVPGHAAESPLLDGECAATAEERLTIIRWIDLGAAYRSAP